MQPADDHSAGHNRPAFSEGVAAQLAAHDEKYAQAARERWAFHHTADPLTRFLRDRRLRVAMGILQDHGLLLSGGRVLVVCGGVGGEGTFLANQGFTDVTTSDFSSVALDTCRVLDPRLKTLELNGEDMAPLADGSYDLALVQDGLHHLPRPALGLTEMLRVSRRGVVVIEPHLGLAGRHLGREWEIEGDAVNYVFRWNRPMLEQVTRSYLLQEDAQIHVRRFWDHNLAVGRAVSRLPQALRLGAAKAIYTALRPADRGGNMLVALIVKGQSSPRQRLLGH